MVECREKINRGRTEVTYRTGNYKTRSNIKHTQTKRNYPCWFRIEKLKQNIS